MTQRSERFDVEELTAPSNAAQKWCDYDVGIAIATPPRKFFKEALAEVIGTLGDSLRVLCSG